MKAWRLIPIQSTHDKVTMNEWLRDGTNIKQPLEEATNPVNDKSVETNDAIKFSTINEQHQSNVLKGVAYKIFFLYYWYRKYIVIKIFVSSFISEIIELSLQL